MFSCGAFYFILVFTDKCVLLNKIYFNYIVVTERFLSDNIPVTKRHGEGNYAAKIYPLIRELKPYTRIA